MNNEVLASLIEYCRNADDVIERQPFLDARGGELIMPTGYTACINDGEGVTFPEFAMRCARAFGALILMRDEPWDAPIPDRFEASDYHSKELAKAQARLAEVEAWEILDAEAEAERTYIEVLSRLNQSIDEQLALHGRYQEMLAQVQVWIPPTSEHEELKEFMVKQLEESIEWDCNCDLGEPKLLSGPDYMAEQLGRAQRDIDYYTEQHREEIKRTKGRNEWLTALRQSLAGMSKIENQADE